MITGLIQLAIAMPQIIDSVTVIISAIEDRHSTTGDQAILAEIEKARQQIAAMKINVC